MYKSIVKRIFDFSFALLLFIPFCICCLILFVIIKIEDGGKIFYKSDRLGKNKKIFKMYKFRSMKENAPDYRNNDGSTFNSDDDPRLTRVGKILRKTSLDELPQIINVLNGTMSFIGPRPDLPEHLDVYEKAEEYKLIVLPGVSGYNQAYFRNSIVWKERLKNDIYYAKNISFTLDMKIFFKTIGTIVFRRGVFVEARNDNEKKL